MTRKIGPCPASLLVRGMDNGPGQGCMDWYCLAVVMKSFSTTRDKTAVPMALYRHRLIFIYLRQIILGAMPLGERRQRCAPEIELVGSW
jgi:hypothetical protein